MEPTGEPTPTTEELQKKLLEQDEKIKSLTESLENLKKDNETKDKEIKDVREINTKLLHRDGILEPRGAEQEHPETMTEFVDSFIKLGVESLERKYGVKNGN